MILSKLSNRTRKSCGNGYIWTGFIASIFSGEDAAGSAQSAQQPGGCGREEYLYEAAVGAA